MSAGLALDEDASAAHVFRGWKISSHHFTIIKCQTVVPSVMVLLYPSPSVPCSLEHEKPLYGLVEKVRLACVDVGGRAVVIASAQLTQNELLTFLC
jgi:hypothetical protein